MLARLSGVLAGCAAALILGVFCVVVADVLVLPEGTRAASNAPPGPPKGLVFLFSTAFLPGFAAFLLYPVTLHRRRRGLTAAVELEILIILAACFTLWMGFVLAAM
ncbi:hypothetical protein D2N39_20885 [Gemmobacter lutimaris]|uniref:Uncharacterized protein n=1 Tax=Gemmobacter lutimaris TaxID=2306023 RepID=A0A398BJS6_9RHOB|nr:MULTISPECIES: hypothetical protein [Gemmobacter]RID89924.1 hypothetical protein D2N39_20885 [Gemmobacter lutimaris]